MKLAENTLREYLDLLGSDAPAPGGGSASALCGAQGASLVAMVAGLTVGKKKYPLDQELCTKVKEEALSLKDDLLKQVDRDTEAFGLVSEAFRLPKETEEQREARATAIAEATLVATKVPFETMKLCGRALSLTKSLVGHSNTNAVSDLGVAALNLIAGIKGAWLNVLINLSGLDDEHKEDRFKKEGEEIVEASQREADEIYGAVCKML